MNDLSLRLDDTDFERLAALGRSLIPTLAPGWTDHNVHDPGIMLIELVAWIADAQTYALGRMRRDERRAYGSLLGVELEGTVPARGLLWPAALEAGAPPRFPVGTVLPVDAPITSDDPKAPTFYPARPIELTTAELISVTSRPADGSPPRDFTRANTQQGASFQPFGEQPAAADRLVLRFRGTLVAASTAGDGLVSIGVELAGEPGAPDPIAPRADPGPPRLRVAVEDSGGERPIEVVEDGTRGLLQSGALLLRIGPEARPYDPTFALTLRAANGALLTPPRVRRIGVNVIPMLQAEDVVQESLVTGLPDQALVLERPGLVFSAGVEPVRLEVAGSEAFEPWRRTNDFGAAGPDDPVYTLDTTAGELRFGNGVNGRLPLAQAAARLAYRVSAGTRGVLPDGLSWKVLGVSGVFGVNSEPTYGGADADTLDTLRVKARVEPRGVLVTRSDLVAAALAFEDLRVERATELTPYPRGCSARGVRTLLVVGREAEAAIRDGAPAGRDGRASDRSSDSGRSEPRDWLGEIRARLSPRLPLGQRLVVIGPDYRSVRVRARLMAAPQLDPELVRRRASDVLAARLAVVAPPGSSEWRLGQSLTSTAVKGWLRATEGVARVLELALLVDGAPVPEGVIELSPAGLPDFAIEPGDVVVERFARGDGR
jgi:hypothetical protein